MADLRIVVVGAGVAGLTTAFLLSKNPRYNVVVIAKHMPGDYDIEYASPWAGANYLPVSAEGTEAEQWDRETWPELAKLAQQHPEAGVHFQDTVRYVRSTDIAGKDKNMRAAGKFQAESWYKHVMPNYRPLRKGELPPGFESGNAFTSVCINTSLYLPWLVSQCLANRVILKRAVLSHILDAKNIHEDGSAHLILNCTGLSAMKLGGVMDSHMVPVRGQTVLVRNTAANMVDVLGTELGSEEVTYIMQRAAGGGTLLGGSYQIGNGDSQLDPNLATRIMKRAIEVCPSLTNGKDIEHLSIIRQGVGLRPMRTIGTRLEKETIDGSLIVHNYGHGGYGYQSSYGCAKAAVRLVDECLVTKPRL